MLKEYYQSDRPTPPHYRHSQTDLTEWDESPHNEHNRNHHHQHGPQQSQRRSGGGGGGPPERDGTSFNGYPYRNGSKDKEDFWEDNNERPRRDGRFVYFYFLNSILNVLFEM